jgi:signal transduction histidine kinase
MISRKRGRSLKLSTRLLLPLLAAVTLVMLTDAWLSLRQREAVMVAESERETRAYATALGLALERAVGHSDPEAVQEMIDRIDRDPNIYGVVIYDTTGVPLYVSSPLALAERAAAADIRNVMRQPSPRTVRRPLEGERAVTVLRPLLDEGGKVHGVLEVVQPLGSVATQLARTRTRYILNTLTLILAVTLLLSWLVRRYLSEPLVRFVKAVRALGSGDLAYRLEVETAVGELAEVGTELNRMADRLEDARRDLVREGEERVSLERRLHQSEKLAEVGRLAAGLAHEIGTPLHVIRGRADLVLQGSGDRDRNLRIIIDQIDRIATIVRNLLSYTRRRMPNPVETDLVALLGSVVEFVEVESQRQRTSIELHVEPEHIPLYADPDLLHQVFLNVVLNALHAVAGGTADGVVIVRARTERKEVGSVAVVEVEDNGSGIPPENRERVFDAFFTTKDGGRGTGLGLALARAIVEDHGGSIALVHPSSRRLSTRLRIELPLSASPAEPLKEPFAALASSARV